MNEPTDLEIVQANIKEVGFETMLILQLHRLNARLEFLEKLSVDVDTAKELFIDIVRRERGY